MSNDDDFKNALPNEVTDHPESGMPRQLRTQADDDRALDAREAEIAGLTRAAQGVYGDDSLNPNAQDRAENEGPQETE